MRQLGEPGGPKVLPQVITVMPHIIFAEKIINGDENKLMMLFQTYSIY